MTKIKVSEATGVVLDWLVARLEEEVSEDIDDFVLSLAGEYAYSADPALAWPIIEREKIETYYQPALDMWAAKCDDHVRYGPTPLIAAMRCYVVSELGEEVDVPEELLS
jgi:Protein of unknown function (DUF2591)